MTKRRVDGDFLSISLGLTLARLANGWREQRRFVVSALKMFGMGKKTLEMRVSEEAEYLCSEFKAKEGTSNSWGCGEGLGVVWAIIGSDIMVI